MYDRYVELAFKTIIVFIVRMTYSIIVTTFASEVSLSILDKFLPAEVMKVILYKNLSQIITGFLFLPYAWTKGLRLDKSVMLRYGKFNLKKFLIIVILFPLGLGGVLELRQQVVLTR